MLPNTHCTTVTGSRNYENSQGNLSWCSTISLLWSSQLENMSTVPLPALARLHMQLHSRGQCVSVGRTAMAKPSQPCKNLLNGLLEMRFIMTSWVESYPSGCRVMLQKVPFYAWQQHMKTNAVIYHHSLQNKARQRSQFLACLCKQLQQSTFFTPDCLHQVRYCQFYFHHCSNTTG